VRQVPLRHELGQLMPPPSIESSKDRSAHASKVVMSPGASTRPVKNGTVWFEVGGVADM
jgi:hypothetical protein